MERLTGGFDTGAVSVSVFAEDIDFSASFLLSDTGFSDLDSGLLENSRFFQHPDIDNKISQR